MSALVEGWDHFQALVSLGDIPGIDDIHIFGAAPDIGANAMADIWWNADVTTHKVWATAAATLDIVSTSADDAAAGIGAREVFIRGLDANLDLVFEKVVTNGLTPVATVNSYLRVNTFAVTEVGEYLTGIGSGNKGVISLKHGANIEAIIGQNPGFLLGYPNTFSFNSHFSVPKNQSLLISNLIVNANATKPINVMMCRREIPTIFSAPFPPLERLGFMTQMEGHTPIPLSDDPINIDGGFDFWFMYETGPGGGTSQVELNGLLIDDD